MPSDRTESYYRRIAVLLPQSLEDKKEKIEKRRIGAQNKELAKNRNNF